METCSRLTASSSWSNRFDQSSPAGDSFTPPCFPSTRSFFSHSNNSRAAADERINPIKSSRHGSPRRVLTWDSNPEVAPTGPCHAPSHIASRRDRQEEEVRAPSCPRRIETLGVIAGVGDGEGRLLGRHPWTYPRRLSDGWSRPSCTAGAVPGPPDHSGAVLSGTPWCSMGLPEFARAQLPVLLAL
jgi:hypothetical protein